MAYRLISAEDYDILKSFAEVTPREDLPEEMTLPFMSSIIPNADVLLTSWGTPNLTDEIIEEAKKLKLIAHTTGSIKALIPNCIWKTGARLTSNAATIAEDVAQTVLIYILCSAKGLWWYAQNTRKGRWVDGVADVFPERRLEEMLC